MINPFEAHRLEIEGLRMPPVIYSFRELIDSAYVGNKGNCEAILKENPEYANLKDLFGYTALMVAALHGHTECVKLLLNVMSQDAIDARACDDTTALYHAAIVFVRRTKSSNAECISLLLNSVSSQVINAQNVSGNTLLMFALRYGLTESAILIANKMSPEALIAKDNKGFNALLYAAGEGDLEFIRFILPKMSSDDINTKTASNSTALMILLRFGHAACLEALVYYMSKEAVTSCLQLLQSEGTRISEDCDQVIKKYFNKMQLAPHATVTAINNRYFLWIDNTTDENELARICRVLDIKDVVIHNGARPETINAMPTSGISITIREGVTPEAVAAIRDVRWVIITEGTTPEDVAALPVHIKRAIIADNASPAAVASLPLNINAVYIGTGNTPEAVASIPRRIITIKLMYDIERSVIMRLPKTGKHITVNDKLSADAVAALHTDVTDVVIQNDLNPKVVQVLFNKYKAITFWLDKKVQNCENYEQLSKECKVIKYEPENMQCVPYKPMF